MTIKLDTVLTTTLVVCALITTGLVAKRSLFPQSQASATAARRPVFLKDWNSYLAEGIQIGPASAKVQLIEFGDFECPFCGTFHKDVSDLLKRYPSQVGLTFVHFPLPMHRFAILAARAAECAGEQGRFVPMYDHLFEEQDGFGIKPWSDYASEAGIPDLSRFDSCMKDTAPVPRIQAGTKLGKEIDIQVTPTLIVNGWKLASPPSPDELNAMVEAVLNGKPPIQGS